MPSYFVESNNDPVAHIFVSYIMKISIFRRSSSSLLFRISSSPRRERFERRVIFGKYWVRRMEIWNHAFLKSNPKKYFDKCEFEEVMVAHVVCRFGWRRRCTSSSWPIIYLMSSRVKPCNGGKPDRDHLKSFLPLVSRWIRVCAVALKGRSARTLQLHVYKRLGISPG